MTRLVLFELFVTNLLLFEHQQKDGSLADSFLDPSSGWRKVVVNRYLEFDRVPRPYETCQKKALQCTLTDRKESKVQAAPGIIINRYRADHSLSIEKPRSAVKGASGWGFKKAAPWHQGGQWEALCHSSFGSCSCSGNSPWNVRYSPGQIAAYSYVRQRHNGTFQLDLNDDECCLLLGPLHRWVNCLFSCLHLCASF